MEKVVSLAERRKDKGSRFVKFVHGGNTPYPMAEKIKIADVGREAAAIHLVQLAEKIRSGSVDSLMVFYQQGGTEWEAEPHAILMDRDNPAFQGLLFDYAWDLMLAIIEGEPFFVCKKNNT